jgi:hypothetical protein
MDVLSLLGPFLYPVVLFVAGVALYAALYVLRRAWT